MRVAARGKAAATSDGALSGAAPSLGGKCVRCRASLAPGTAVCQRCHTVVASGRRLPMVQRLVRMRLRTGMALLIGALVLGVGAFLGKDFYDNYRRRQQPPATVDMRTPSATQPTDSARTQVAALLSARGHAQRRTALQALRPQGASALELLAGSLAEAPAMSAAASQQQTFNLLGAIELFAAAGDARHVPALERLGAAPTLRSAALVARGMLGDARVGDELVAAWRECLRRRLFIERMLALASPDEQAALRPGAERCAAQHAQVSEALRVLGAGGDATLLTKLVSGYWDAWGWLGQVRDERVVSALFECAKPPARQGLDVRESVRTARRALEASAAGAPETAAAALLVLTYEAPQYESLRRALLKRLVEAIPAASPAAQQRLAWSVSRLAGGELGKQARHPGDVSGAMIRAVLDWARQSGVVDVSPPPPRGAPPRPAVPELRVLSARRQHQDALLPALESPQWDLSRAALREWIAADLGYPTRVQARLSPETRGESEPALAAALTLAAVTNAQSDCAVLELWRQSSDQPAWVRDLATVGLAALSARRGESPRDWTAQLSAPLDPRVLGHLAYIIVAGGPKLEAAVRDAKGGWSARGDRQSLLAQIASVHSAAGRR